MPLLKFCFGSKKFDKLDSTSSEKSTLFYWNVKLYLIEQIDTEYINEQTQKLLIPSKADAYANSIHN